MVGVAVGVVVVVGVVVGVAVVVGVGVGVAVVVVVGVVVGVAVGVVVVVKIWPITPASARKRAGRITQRHRTIQPVQPQPEG